MSTDEEIQHLELAYERLRAARALLELGFLADAASRSYYAMHHAAYALLRTEGHAPKTHRGLNHLLAEHFVGDHALSEEQVQALRHDQEVRELSDYEPDYHPSEEEVRDMLDRAERFVERVKEILG